MTTAYRIIEEDHGTYTRTPHPHNGYFAGDFGAAPGRSPLPATTSVKRFPLHPSELLATSR